MTFKGYGPSAAGDGRKLIPVLTVIVFVLTAVPSLAQFGDTLLLDAWRRDPAAIDDGQWWRLASSLVVQDGGVIGTVVNLAFPLIVGALTERVLGRWRWALLYLAGAAAGQATGYLTATEGAGNSIAVCGLAGGLLATSLRRPVEPQAAPVAATWAMVVAASAVPGAVAAGVAGAIAGGVGIQLVARRERLPGWLCVTIGAVVAIVLCTLLNLHGPPLAAGLLVGALLPRPRSIGARGPLPTSRPVPDTPQEA